MPPAPALKELPAGGGSREPENYNARWLVLQQRKEQAALRKGGGQGWMPGLAGMVSEGNASWQEPQHFSKWFLIGTE